MSKPDELLAAVTLHYCLGKSNKFYRVIISEKGKGTFNYERRWGRIGTKGTGVTCTYSNVNEAYSAGWKMIASKVNKGYVPKYGFGETGKLGVILPGSPADKVSPPEPIKPMYPAAKYENPAVEFKSLVPLPNSGDAFWSNQSFSNVKSNLESAAVKPFPHSDLGWEEICRVELVSVTGGNFLGSIWHSPEKQSYGVFRSMGSPGSMKSLPVDTYSERSKAFTRLSNEFSNRMHNWIGAVVNTWGDYGSLPIFQLYGNSDPASTEGKEVEEKATESKPPMKAASKSAKDLDFGKRKIKL